MIYTGTQVAGIKVIADAISARARFEGLARPRVLCEMRGDFFGILGRN